MCCDLTKELPWSSCIKESGNGENVGVTLILLLLTYWARFLLLLSLRPPSVTNIYLDLMASPAYSFDAACSLLVINMLKHQTVCIEYSFLLVSSFLLLFRHPNFFQIRLPQEEIPSTPLYSTAVHTWEFNHGKLLSPSLCQSAFMTKMFNPVHFR